MSNVCEICDKKTQTMLSRSHSRIGSKRYQKVNLQSKKINGKKAKVCTNCIKTLSKKSQS